MSANLVYHAKTKHVELDVHFVREKIADNKLKVKVELEMTGSYDGGIMAIELALLFCHSQMLLVNCNR
ncbi:hypothetical protein V6N13_125283 [Hibiscus sabdariffa]